MFVKLSELKSRVWQAMYTNAVDGQLSIVVTDQGPILQLQVKPTFKRKALLALEGMGDDGRSVILVVI